MAVNITTAIDSLVNLVKTERKISLEDASKKLGIPANILNEWAVFLEEENILEIEYKITTPFLKIKTKTVEIDKVEFENQIELIKRKLDFISAKLNQIKSNLSEKEIKGILKDKSKLPRLDKITLNQVRKYVLEKEIGLLKNKIKKAKPENFKDIKTEFEKIIRRSKVMFK